MCNALFSGDEQIEESTSELEGQMMATTNGIVHTATFVIFVELQNFIFALMLLKDRQSIP